MATGQRVGVIGLGIMGSAMAANLVRGGFEVVGYDVAAKQRSALSKAGGNSARSVGDAARRAPILITSLPSAAALLQVAAELAAAGRKGQIVIEASTMPIAVKDEARGLLHARGVILLDCPLSGTGAQARTKDLLVYASGSASAYKQCVPVFEGFARGHHYLGAFGNGSKMKFVANLLVAIHNVAAAEAIVLGLKAGLDPALVVKVVGDGAGSSRMLQVRGPMMAKNNYSDATMKVEVWQKDMTIIGDFVRELDCPAPLFAASAPVYNAAMALGYAQMDTGSVCAVLEASAATKRRLPRGRK